jgi:hypothetical protein
VELHLHGVILTEASLRRSLMLPYLCSVVRLIEGVALTRPELEQLLLAALRQHSMAKRTRRDFQLAFLHQRPP